MITLSFHARRRCRKRGISYGSVFSALRKGLYVPLRSGVYKVIRKRLRVILAVTGLVITVYKVRRFRKSTLKRRRQMYRRYKREEQHWTKWQR